MKKLALAAALSVVATGAFAGGVEPVIEPVVIVEDTSTSAGGILVPVLALLLIAAAVAAKQLIDRFRRGATFCRSKPGKAGC
jgi:hypothetical protein